MKNKIHCFTSITFSYLAKARVLGWSLRRFHPDWSLTLCVTDRKPEGFKFDIDDEAYDHIIWTDELNIENVKGWLFKHDVVEICTSVKGPVLSMLCETDADKVFYLDPDTVVFESLQPLVDLLDDNEILLTPHQIEPDNYGMSIIDNEISSLKHGVYNLGFVGIRTDGEGRRFANWWKDRLLKYCYDDTSIGLFVDQRWCDLIPAFFNGVKVLRDPSYNVASWNLNKRNLSITKSGDILVNGLPLRFFHFTKLGPIGDVMTQRYAQDNTEVYELWSWYKRMVKRFTDPDIPEKWWYYNAFQNGEKITQQQRLLYRHREDLQNIFSDPYSTENESYLSWYKSEVSV